ncbi:MAG: methylated-DNA--[Eggerthellaceae bacterium]|nr:methylated-DNA--[protein]-cysteine S-methyltransferase [Eggerthellaceae bacterium]
MTETTYNWYRTPIGFVTIAADEIGICRVVFGCEDIPGARKMAKGLTTAAATQLLEYFAGKRKTFDLPLHLVGSPYRLAVWDAVRDIPYGQCETSASLAEKMALATSATAVGGALRENPLAIIIPDHRVITATGRAWGDTASAKRREWLLYFEQHSRT